MVCTEEERCTTRGLKETTTIRRMLEPRDLARYIATVAIIKTPLDPIAITQGSEWYHNFLPQAVGIVAESDLGTEGLRWMDCSRFAWVLWPD
jgi:hypothetical protein